MILLMVILRSANDLGFSIKVFLPVCSVVGMDVPSDGKVTCVQKWSTNRHKYGLNAI